MPAAELDLCPKRMTFGPCGGVDARGGCEAAAHPCVFLDAPTRRWEAVSAAPPGTASPRTTASSPTPRSPLTPITGADVARHLRARLAGGASNPPVVVADLPDRPLDAGSVERAADVLRGRVDAVLLGESPAARVQWPPAIRAQLALAVGLVPWIGVTCRDRNRVALEAELAALALVGAPAVHCVTGDHPAVGHRADAAAVFDLDSTRTAALARAAGLLVSVAESPAAPPRERRAARLVEKLRAGATVAYVDHCGGPDAVAAFASEVRARCAATGTSEPALLACVPVVVDHGSAALLASFPGLALPDGFLAEVLGAADPRRAGVEAAVRLARGMLAVPGVVGVNLSGGPTAGQELPFAEALAEIADRVRAA